MFDAKQMIADEMAEAAQPEPQQYTVPPQRVGWAYREMAKAGLQPQSQRNEDGSHTFHVKDPQTGAILEGILNFESRGRTWGNKGTGKAPRSRMMFMVIVIFALIGFGKVGMLILALGVSGFLASFALWPLFVMIGVVVFMLFLAFSHRNDELFLDSHNHDIDGNPR